MKQITFTIFLFSAFIFESFAQVNPVSGLTWNWHYNFGNFYELRWNEPATPHDEIVGYNIYREDALYRFQTGTNMFYLEQGNNCDGDFQMYDMENPDGSFHAHVTAVYAGGIESDFTENVEIGPPALKNQTFEKQKAIVYPNPTTGILNIGNQNLSSIQIYDLAGKQIKVFQKQPQIDFSEFAKGTYFVKLISPDSVLIEKIIVK